MGTEFSIPTAKRRLYKNELTGRKARKNPLLSIALTLVIDYDVITL